MAPVKPADDVRTRGAGKLAPGLRLPREVVSQSQRERLTIAMIELVDLQGYPQTGIAELTSRSHVSRGAFYEHFANIQDCFAAAYDTQAARCAAQLVSAYNTPGLKSLPRARATLEAFERFAHTWPPASRVCLADVLTVEHGAIEQRSQAGAAARAILQAALGSGTTLEQNLAIALTTATVGAMRRVTYNHLRAEREDANATQASAAPASDELSEAMLAWMLSYRSRGEQKRASRSTRGGATRGGARQRTSAARTRDAARAHCATPAAAADSEVETAADARARIMQAVLTVAGRKGLAAMTHRDIATTAGVSYSTIYKHFPDKQQALLAVCEQIDERLTTPMRQAAAAAEDHWPTTVREGLRAYLQAAAAEPAATRVMALQALSLGHVGLRFLDRRAEALKGLLAGAPEPRSTEYAHAISDALVGAILEIVHEHALSRSVEYLPRQLPALTYIVLAPYIGARDAALISAEA